MARERTVLTVSDPFPADAPVLFYDAECSVCARSVRVVLRLEGRRGREGAVRFAARRGMLGDALHAARPALETIDSVVWRRPDGAVLVRSDAVIEVCRYLGGPWRLFGAVASAVPRGVRDALYRVFARNRHRFRSADAGCLVPPADQRWRFLDASVPPAAGANTVPHSGHGWPMGEPDMS